MKKENFKKKEEKFKKFLKYTGSKEHEYEIIKKYLPQTINNYYEPFFGGGAVFFKLKYDNLIDNKSFANDLSESLIRFYNSLKYDEFKKYLLNISKCWDEIGVLDSENDNLTKIVVNFIFDDFKECLLKKKEIIDVLNDSFKDFISKTLVEKCPNITNYNCHGFNLIGYILCDLNKRLNRFRNQKIIDIDTFIKNIIETSLHQSFYFMIRDMYNEWNTSDKSKDYDDFEKSSHWYFIRQFCWAGMFRFGKDGNFNIPYGGKSYNTKCFECNINDIYNTQNINFITDENTIFTNCDYKDVLKTSFNDNDFIFLDPPYDSTFSSYDNLLFGEDKQQELANILYNLKCNWMLVIKKTELIEELYDNKDGIYITEYDKKYTFKGKGDYENEVKHLIIRNYE